MTQDWDYRVIRHKPGFLIIHKVFYTGDKPVNFELDSVELCGDTIEEFKLKLEMLQKALEKPILNFEDI